MPPPDTSSVVDRYLETLHSLLERFRTTQRSALTGAAQLLAARLRHGGVVHLFGTGHSHMLAEEVFYRAGGLIPINPMLDPSVVLSGGALRSTETERRSGAAAEIAARYDLQTRDAGVVISNSGRNPAPVEMAQIFKRTGMAVVGVTNVSHSAALAPLDPPGVRLLDVCDVVLDTCGVLGDAGLELPSVPYPVGPTSTVIGAAIMQSLMIGVMEDLLASDSPVLNLPSANVPNTDLERIITEIGKYRSRIRHL